ncbi:MAG: polysaccharide biosynthesis protein [Clostridia bacterium]|nr:polysaccharide biosynthesis protein [Clostridia bacterium]
MKRLNFFKNSRLRKMLLFVFDILCFCAVDAVYYYTATFLFNREIEPKSYLICSGILLAVTLLLRIFSGVYFVIYRYTDTAVYLRLAVTDALAYLVSVSIAAIFNLRDSVWDVMPVAALSLLMLLASRFTYRLVYKALRHKQGDAPKRVRIAVLGAGEVGAFLVTSIQNTPNSPYDPAFFIDNDKTKVNSTLRGLRVYYESPQVLDLIREQEIDEIFFAIANLDNETASRLYDFYSQTNCRIKIFDKLFKEFDELQGEPMKSIREVRIEDLLFRQSIALDQNAFEFYRDKVVLITGGGGSIGSELCRQVASHDPRQLIILDIYENNAYDIQQELVQKYGDRLNLAVEIASVRDRDRLRTVFERYHPQIVFHAAAHKHVPLMEHCPGEAIKNNVFGTRNTADLAKEFGVERFILISTDKAVNPTNIMGASKRICEMIALSRNDGNTVFTAVRFGNVLGSNGSVIPLFRRQIAEGGPVTITDKRIIRYFMTIAEASQLVMSAGAMAKRGELFVLDMGKPVKIYDLAVNMIKLSGLRPDQDIEIKEIGLRPGEKLYEELLIRSETLTQTENKLIFIEKDPLLPREKVDADLETLWNLIQTDEDKVDYPALRAAVAAMVPTFRPPEEVNREAAQAREMQMVYQDEEKQPATV